MEISPRSSPTIEALLARPKDLKLVVGCLFNWISLKRVPCDIVIFDDVYRTEPWNLLAKYQLEEEGYFLTAIKGNHNPRARRNRIAGEGSYVIQHREDSKMITGDFGIAWCKSTFNYQCKEKGERKRTRKTSGWVMHEYQITSMDSEWVLCRVKLSDNEISRRKRRCKESSKSKINAVPVVDQREQLLFEGFKREQGKELAVAQVCDCYDLPISQDFDIVAELAAVDQREQLFFEGFECEQGKELAVAQVGDSYDPPIPQDLDIVAELAAVDQREQLLFEGFECEQGKELTVAQVGECYDPPVSQDLFDLAAFAAEIEQQLGSVVEESTGEEQGEPSMVGFEDFLDLHAAANLSEFDVMKLFEGYY